MATKKGIYKVLNSQGTYDSVFFQTDASQVIESDSKSFVSLTEKNTWNNKADTGHKHNSNDITDATDANTAGKIIKRDSNGDFSARNMNGNASTATALQTARTINGVSFDGTKDITISATPTTHNHDDLYKRKTEDYRITPKVLAGGQDLNSLYVSGHYISDSDANSITIINRPPGSTGFSLEVRTIYGTESATGRTIQTATIRTTNTVYIRSKSETGEWTNWIKQWNESTLTFGTGSEQMARGNHTHNYLSLSGGNLTGELTINSNKVYHAGNKPTAADVGAATTLHNHNTGQVTALTGYSKASSFSKLTATDTLNVALGKLEKGLDDKKDASWNPSWSDITSKPSTFNPAAHSHVSSEISKMTGYVKGAVTSAILATDTLNAAISKLEVGLDGKSDVHTHPYRPNSWVPSWSDVTSKPSFATVATSGSYNDLTNKPNLITINDSTTTATTQTWSAKKINDSLATKAASSHTHNTSEVTGLGSAASLDAGTSANQVLKLDASGKVPVSTLPSIAINETFTAADESAALLLTVEVGDIVILTSNSNTYICVDRTKSTFAEKFKPLSSSTDSITKTEVENLLSNKVDKVSGKGLSTNDFTSAYKTKLDGIATGANKYVHPNDSNTRHVTDAQIASWDSKASGTHNHNSSQITDATSANTANTIVKRDSTGLIAVSSLNLGNNEVRQGGGTNNALVLSATGGNVYLRPDKLDTSKEVVVSTTNITFNGNKIYHAGDKPTPSEIGAAAASHGNHVPTTQTANARVFLRNDNTWQTLPSASTSATGIVQLTDSTSSTSTTTAATPNSVKLAYDLANSKASGTHGHNNIVSRGVTTMESSTTRPAVTGLSMTEAYNNSYPTAYGNVMTMRGGGDGQLLIGWSGTSGAHAPVYVRSRRNDATAPWSDWAQVYTTANKPTLTDLGIATLTRGSYLTGSNYNGTSATTWAVDATTTATASKVVARDGNADIMARLFRSNYANQSTISGAMAFRVSNSGDDYIRFCSDTSAIRTFLSVYAKTETYTRTEMDNRYAQKAAAVFTDTISIVTPAA